MGCLGNTKCSCQVIPWTHKSGGQGRGLAWRHPDGGEITKCVIVDGEVTWGSDITRTGPGCFSWPLWPVSGLRFPWRDVLVLLPLSIRHSQFLAFPPRIKAKAKLASFWLKRAETQVNLSHGECSKATSRDWKAGILTTPH